MNARRWHAPSFLMGFFLALLLVGVFGLGLMALQELTREEPTVGATDEGLCDVTGVAESLTRAAQHALDEGRLDDAMEHARAALRLQPGTPQATLVLLTALHGLGRTEEMEREHDAFHRLHDEMH
ncbi:MAG: hypothetical protein AB2A00_03450 [Myxococcota bacterium]